jgi:hypothetical protein
MRVLQVVTLFVAVLGAISTSARQAVPVERVRAQPVFADDPVRASTVPVGAKVDVRLGTVLDSGTAKVDQRFEATTTLDYVRDGRALIPAVTPVRGFISSVRASSTANRAGSLTLSFDDMRIGDQSPRLRASVEQVFSGRLGEDAARFGADAAVGAAISRLPGGGQGLFVGVMVGAGGSIVSTEATDVKLPVGTILRIRIDQAVQIPDGR